MTDGFKIYDDPTKIEKGSDELNRMMLFVCEHGSISITVDITEHRMPADSIMVLRPGHHVSHYSVSEDFQGYVVVLSPSQISDVVPSMQTYLPIALQFLKEPVIAIEEWEMKDIMEIYKLLRRRWEKSNESFAYKSFLSLCKVLFFEVLTLYSRRITQRPTTLRRDELLTQFIAMVERDYRAERSVTYYASKLFVTPKHLSATVRQASGYAAGVWIDWRVTAEAMQLLSDTGMSVQEISQTLNFKTQSLFGKYFKQHTGLSPREFRAKRV